MPNGALGRRCVRLVNQKAALDADAGSKLNPWRFWLKITSQE